MIDSFIVEALVKIASYQRGGVITMGSLAAERDEMIGTARETLKRMGIDLRTYNKK